MLPLNDHEYWQRVASAAHQWGHVVHSIWMQAFRAHREGTFNGDFYPYLDELEKARTMFEAEYHLALTCRTLADADIPLVDFVRELSSEHQ